MSAPTLDQTRAEEEVRSEVDDLFVEAVRGDFHERVALRGEVDMATVPRLQAVLDGVLARQPWRIEVDLSGVTFLSVHAVSTLLVAHRRLAERRARLVLRDPTPIARRVLTLTGTDHLIETLPAATA